MQQTIPNSFNTDSFISGLRFHYHIMVGAAGLLAGAKLEDCLTSLSLLSCYCSAQPLLSSPAICFEATLSP